jgi:exosome complex RNA-binding protein Rrp4
MTFEFTPVVRVLPGKAIDITVGNNGVIYVTIENGEIYKYNFTTKTWTKVTEAAVSAHRICASAYDIPWYTKLDPIDSNKFVY